MSAFRFHGTHFILRVPDVGERYSFPRKIQIEGENVKVITYGACSSLIILVSHYVKQSQGHSSCQAATSEPRMGKIHPAWKTGRPANPRHSFHWNLSGLEASCLPFHGLVEIKVCHQLLIICGSALLPNKAIQIVTLCLFVRDMEKQKSYENFFLIQMII